LKFISFCKTRWKIDSVY